MKNKPTETKTIALLFTMTSIMLLFITCLPEGVFAKTETGEMVEVYMPPHMVVECAADLEAKILDDSFFAAVRNLDDLRKAYLQNRDYSQYPLRSRLYEAILGDLGSSLGKTEYPRAILHQALLNSLGPDVMSIVSRCVLFMDLYDVMTPQNSEHLFRDSKNRTRFYPLQKDILDVLEFLQIPLTQSVEGITEFSLEYSPIATAEKEDIHFVGIKNGKKVSIARVSRQQILDDWAKIHDAVYTLCQQPVKMPNCPLSEMPGTKRVRE